MQLALDMKGSGKMTNNMVKESKVGQTEHFTKEIMLQVKKKVTESTVGRMDLLTMVSGQIIKLKDLVPTFGKMVRNAMVSGWRVNFPATVS